LVTYRTVIAHISQGPSNASTKAWFETYPKKINGKVLPEKYQYVAGHFGIEKNGRIDQFVDTRYIYHGAGAANPHAIHVENVGMSGQQLTDDQVEMLGNIIARANQTHGVALQLNFSRAESVLLNSGLGYHAQYGGHLLWLGRVICSTHTIAGF
jgi:N-acetyl-anhydromuramyl-L-alanine amidase AmpD